MNISKGAINGATRIVTSIICNIANEVTSTEMKVTSTWKMSLENTHFTIHTHIHTHLKLIATKPNICSSSGGAQEKGKTGWNSVYHQNCCKN